MGDLQRDSHLLKRFFVSVKSAALALVALLAASLSPVASAAAAPVDVIGIVVMHGKGGSPNSRYIEPFARELESRGLLVANLEMPWSGGRNYDVPVSRAEEEVEEAISGLRAKGARKVFLAGHSQGGGFAIHLGGKQRADGIIAIAPGGNVGGPVYRRRLSDVLDKARKLVAEGKGAEPAQLADYEGGHGVYSLVSVPAAYVTWFDPEGAMNIPRAARAVDPKVPVLYIVPTRDYPGLLKTAPTTFGALPKNPHTRRYDPSADHLHAPSASVDEIVRWTREVAGVK